MLSDDRVAAEWALSTTNREYQVSVPREFAYDGMFVSFVNDGFDTNLGDRNVWVEQIVTGRDVMDPATLYSKGTWNGTDCGVGYRNSNWLHCNGWFGTPAG